MTDILLQSARLLTEDQAGGHSRRWTALGGEGTDYFAGFLANLAQAEFVAIGMLDKTVIAAMIARGERNAFALLYTGQAPGACKTGLMSVIEVDVVGDVGRVGSAFRSGFPFLGDGALVIANVEGIELFPSRMEARLVLRLADGTMVRVFEPLFWQHRGVYRQDQQYAISIAGLAYSIRPARDAQHTITSLEAIHALRARDAMVDALELNPSLDVQAILAAWQPANPQELEPIDVNLGEMVALSPEDEAAPSDDADYQGEVMQITPRAACLMGVYLWRIDLALVRGDPDAVIPIYVPEHLFDGAWRPRLGQYVTGEAWIQGYATAAID